MQPLPADTARQPAARFDDGVIGERRRRSGRLWGLTAALTTDARTGLTGTAVHRAAARGHAARAEPVGAARRPQRAGASSGSTAVGTTVDDLFGAVTIVNPGGSYTLATERSPLPLALRNDLPVPIRVRLQVDAPPGMTVTDIGEIELPPGYPAAAGADRGALHPAGRRRRALRTADGLPLGEPVRLSVHSNAYGKVLFFITLSGGGGAGRCWPAAGCGTGSAASPTAPTWTGPSAATQRPRPDPLDVALAHRPDEDR